MTKARKLKRKTRYRIMICGIASLAFIVYFIVSALYYGIDVTELSNEKEQLALSLKDLIAKEEELSSEITKLKDPDYVARYARENYLYSKDGEYIIKIDRANLTADANQDDDANETNLENIILIGAGSLAIIVILGMILKRNKKKVLKNNSHK